MKRGLRRKCAIILAVSFVFCGVAVAALPLALLIEPAANFAGGLLLRSVARQTVVSVGVAANDASWLLPLTNLVSRAASILSIAGSAFQYEIPVLPDVPLNGGVDSSAVGDYLLATSPFVSLSYSASEASGFCGESGNYMPSKTFPSWASFAQTCNEYLIASNSLERVSIHSEQYPDSSTYMNGITYLDLNGVTKTVVVKQLRFCKGPSSNPCSTTAKTRTDGWLSPSIREVADGVKRFKRSGSGFLIDSSDPDWTEQEKAAFISPAALKFVDAQGQVVRVSENATGTQIDAATQSGNDVKLRTATLNTNAQAVSVNEQVVANAQASDAVATSPALGSATGSQNIVLPTDYARTGAAANDATQLATAE